uniref:Mediator of RNA polymerase II transcription subunit 13 n=2 Tax=Zeugodacus cucurbitae TaxID=28588 RepID=A0A0A1X3M8_ZEUCU
MASSPTPSLDSIRGTNSIESYGEHTGYLSDSPLTLSGSSPPVSDSAICDEFTSTGCVSNQHHPISASVSSSSSSSSSGLSGCGSTSSANSTNSCNSINNGISGGVLGGISCNNSNGPGVIGSNLNGKGSPCNSLLANNRIVSVSTANGGAVPRCTACKSKQSDAVARCFECISYLCANCVTAHQFMHCFNGHNVSLISGFETTANNVTTASTTPTTSATSTNITTPSNLTANDIKLSSSLTMMLQQQQQQQMHTVTTVTTVATSSSQASSSGGTNGISSSSNSSIAMVEQHLHELTARAQPYYDTTASSFTGNTTNTHASPQAATEMPERVWQDCITNTLHVTYAASVAATATSSGATSAQITCSSLSTTTGGVSATTATGSGTVGGEDCNSTSSTSGGNNGNSDNNGGGGGGVGSGVCSAMSTQNANTNPSDANGMEAKLRMQQLQFWGFVDPMEKAPCTCTKTLNPASMTPHDTPHGGASTYSRNSVGDLLPVPSVGSPGTPAQSPHPNSTLSQPTSVPPADQLSTMSPRAPPSVPNLQQPPTPIDHLLDKNTPAPTPTDQHDNKSSTTSPYVRPTPSVEPPPSVEAGNGGGGGGGVSGVGPNGPGSVPQPPSVGRCTPTIGGQQQQQQQQGSQAQLSGSTGSSTPQCGSITIKKFEVHQPSLSTLSADQIKTEPGYAPTPLAGGVSRNGLPVVSMASGMSAADAINDYWKSFKMPEIKSKLNPVMRQRLWRVALVEMACQWFRWHLACRQQMPSTIIGSPLRCQKSK